MGSKCHLIAIYTHRWTCGVIVHVRFNKSSSMCDVFLMWEILTMTNSFIIYISTIFSPSLYPLSSSSPFLPACISISTLTGQRTTAQSMQLPSLTSSEYSRRHSSSWEENPLSYVTGLLSICLSMYPTLSILVHPKGTYM